MELPLRSTISSQGFYLRSYVFYFPIEISTTDICQLFLFLKSKQKRGVGWVNTQIVSTKNLRWHGRIQTGGSMNPVRTLGPAVATGNFKGLWIYLVAPPLGALAGAATYTVLKIRDRPQNQVQELFLSLLFIMTKK